MSPIATTIICAARYSHGRSLAPHEEVIAAAVLLWPMLDARDRAHVLNIWRTQDIPELRRDAENARGVVPVSGEELRREADAWERLCNQLEVSDG